jgi:hypothetical protein
MDRAADLAAQLASTNGTRTCPTPGAAVLGAAALLIATISAVATRSYSGIAIGLGLIGLYAWVVWRSPIVTSRRSTRLSYLVPGQWIVLTNDRCLPIITLVTARFDDFSFEPGAVVSLGLGNGTAIDGPATNLIPTAELTTLKKHAQGFDDIQTTLASEQFFGVMAQAFDARREDGRPDWSESDANPKVEEVLRLASKFRLLQLQVGARTRQGSGARTQDASGYFRHAETGVSS